MMKNPAQTPAPAIADMGETIVSEFAAGLAAEIKALLPGFAPPALPQAVAEKARALAEAMDAEEADKARRAALDAELTDLSAAIVKAVEEIEAVHASGRRDDVAAGRVGLLQRDVAALKARAEEVRLALAAPRVTATAARAALEDAQRRARAEAFGMVCAELDSRLVRAATKAKASTAGQGVGHRWRPSAAIQEAARTGVF